MKWHVRTALFMFTILAGCWLTFKISRVAPMNRKIVSAYFKTSGSAPLSRTVLANSEASCKPTRDGYGTCLLKNVCLPNANNQDDTDILFGGIPPRNQFYLTRNAVPEPSATIRFTQVKSFPNVKALDGTWAWIDRYHTSNAGHTLGDEVLAAFRLKLVWNVSQLKVLTDIRSPSISQYEFIGMGGRNVVTRDELLMLQGHDVCFKKLIVGVAHFGYAYGPGVEDTRELALPPFRETFGLFRRAAWAAHNVHPLRKPHMARILVLKKGGISEHSHVFGHEYALVSALQKAFPRASVRCVVWAGMPPGEQVAAMASADIVISRPGSDIMNVAWMQLHAILVLVCRFEGVNPCDATKMNCGNEVGLWFDRSGHNIDCWCEPEFQKWLHCDNNTAVTSSKLLIPPQRVVHRVNLALHKLEVLGRIHPISFLHNNHEEDG